MNHPPSNSADPTGKLTRSIERLTCDEAEEYFGVRRWGMGYFGINPDGEATISAPQHPRQDPVPFPRIIEGLRQRGLELPVMLRLENIVDDRIRQLHETFQQAIQETGYRGVYRGVFPIKVNQQCQVIQEIARFGNRFQYGLEAGSKAELLIAMSTLGSRDCQIICNGFKDAEFIDLGCQALRMGYPCFFVIESPRELALILERCQRWDVRPRLGVRVKLSTEVEGHWSADSGDRSLFGLSSLQLMAVVEQLREQQALSCLELLHFHLGSQIPSIRNIRQGVTEACRYYVDLKQEGAPLGYLDIGGGLAVDYDGTASTDAQSRNYDLMEYCVDVLESVMDSLDANQIEHPTLISETGRWTVAPMSVLIFNILEVSRYEPHPIGTLSEPPHPEVIETLLDTLRHLPERRLQESYNDVVYAREQLQNDFLRGAINLRDRAAGENIVLQILQQIAERVPTMKRPPASLLSVPDMLADIYYGNFSVFQSLPDSWAIDQIFPIMPLQRLNERPTQTAVIGDLTCDCDGKLDRAPLADGSSPLKLHRLQEGEDYCVGVFLVGAYQETLGDLHNLFGDANVASVRLAEDGSLQFVHELEGDSIGDVLSYVEYQPPELIAKFRAIAEEAVERQQISVEQRREMMTLFTESLRGYTYFES